MVNRKRLHNYIKLLHTMNHRKLIQKQTLTRCKNVIFILLSLWSFTRHFLLLKCLHHAKKVKCIRGVKFASALAIFRVDFRSDLTVCFLFLFFIDNRVMIIELTSLEKVIVRSSTNYARLIMFVLLIYMSHMINYLKRRRKK